MPFETPWLLNFSTNSALLLKDYPFDPGPIRARARSLVPFRLALRRVKNQRSTQVPSRLQRAFGARAQPRAIARLFQAESVEGSRAEHARERADYRTRTHARGTQHGNRGRT